MLGSGAVRGLDATVFIHVTGGFLNFVSRLGKQLGKLPISWAGGCILNGRGIYHGRNFIFQALDGLFCWAVVLCTYMTVVCCNDFGELMPARSDAAIFCWC